MLLEAAKQIPDNHLCELTGMESGALLLLMGMAMPRCGRGLQFLCVLACCSSGSSMKPIELIRRIQARIKEASKGRIRKAKFWEEVENPGLAEKVGYGKF